MTGTDGKSFKEKTQDHKKKLEEKIKSLSLRITRSSGKANSPNNVQAPDAKSCMKLKNKPNEGNKEPHMKTTFVRSPTEVRAMAECTGGNPVTIENTSGKPLTHECQNDNSAEYVSDINSVTNANSSSLAQNSLTQYIEEPPTENEQEESNPTMEDADKQPQEGDPDKVELQPRSNRFEKEVGELFEDNNGSVTIKGPLTEDEINNLLEKNRKRQDELRSTEQTRDKQDDGGKKKKKKKSIILVEDSQEAAGSDMFKIGQTDPKLSQKAEKAERKKEKKERRRKEKEDEKRRGLEKTRENNDATQNQITDYWVKNGTKNKLTEQRKKGKDKSKIHWLDEEISNSTPLRKTNNEPSKAAQETLILDNIDVNWLERRQEEEQEKICLLLESDEEEEPEEEEEVGQSSPETDNEEEHNSAKPQAIKSKEGINLSNVELLGAMNAQFEKMYTLMETNKVEIKDSLQKNMKAEVKSQTKKSTKSMKIKIASYMTEELGNLKKFTNTVAMNMDQKIEEKVASSGELLKKILKMEEALEFFNKRYEEHENWRTGLEQNDAARIQTFNAALGKITACEQKMEKNEDDINSQERRWRKNNLRISNLDTYNRQDTVKDTVARFISEHGLLAENANMFEIRNEIETVYRFGPTQRNRPKQIMVRFYSTDTRNIIMKNSKNTGKSKEIQPVYLQDDLSPIDYQYKQSAKPYMKDAHSKGKEPRFWDGKVKINDASGKRTEIPKTKVMEYYNLHKPTKGQYTQHRRTESQREQRTTPVYDRREEQDTGTNKKGSPSKHKSTNRAKTQPEVVQSSHSDTGSDSEDSTEQPESSRDSSEDEPEEIEEIGQEENEELTDIIKEAEAVAERQNMQVNLTINTMKRMQELEQQIQDLTKVSVPSTEGSWEEQSIRNLPMAELEKQLNRSQTWTTNLVRGYENEIQRRIKDKEIEETEVET